MFTRFFLIFAITFGSQSSQALLNAIELLRDRSNYVLIINDGHLSNGTPSDGVREVEHWQLQELKALVRSLIESHVESYWVLESAESELTATAKTPLLLCEFPTFLETLQGAEHTTIVHADFRRRQLITLMAWFEERAFTPIMQKALRYLAPLNPWTREEVLLLKGSKSLAARDVLHIVDKYMKEIDELADFVVKNLKTQFAKLKRSTNFSAIDKIFTDLEREVTASRFQVHKEAIVSCQGALKDTMNKLDANLEMSLTTAILTKVENDRSLAALDLSDSKLDSCLSDTVADTDFFMEIMKGQESGDWTIFFGGRAHGVTLSNELKTLGYKSVFAEGELVKDDGRRKLDVTIDKSKAISKQVLQKRLQEILNLASKHQSEL